MNGSSSGFTPLTDWNDLAAEASLDAVREGVEAAERAAEQAAEQAAHQHEPAWPEPMLPGVLRTQNIPPSILPGAWGDMAAAVARSSQTPTAISVLCCLGVLGTLLQRRFEVDCGTHTEPLSIWAVSVQQFSF